MPTRTDDLPRTIKRSPAKARRTYAKTLDNAVEEYGDGERAHRTAMAALKHSFEKVGDHWEPKKSPALRTSGRCATSAACATAGARPAGWMSRVTPSVISTNGRGASAFAAARG